MGSKADLPTEGDTLIWPFSPSHPHKPSSHPHLPSLLQLQGIYVHQAQALKWLKPKEMGSKVMICGLVYCLNRFENIFNPCERRNISCYTGCQHLHILYIIQVGINKQFIINQN